MSLIEDLREKVAEGRFEFSRHAVDQVLTRRILVAELIEAFAEAEVVEDYPNDKVWTELFDPRLDEDEKAAAYPMQLSIAAHGEDRHGL